MDLQVLRQLAGPRPEPRRSIVSIQSRLSLLMFIMYMAPGAVVPLLSLRLKELGFSPIEIGWCCATQALGSLIAPLIAGQIADRWLSSERCLAVCSFISAFLLWQLASLTTPNGVFAVHLALWLVMAPTLTLGTATCFAHLPDARREFGRVRMWGTVGWVGPGWLLGMWLASGEASHSVLSWLRPQNPLPELADAFRLASLLAAAFGIYAFTLPHTPPRRTSGGSAPLAAIRMLKGRAFAVYAICTLGIAAALPFSSQLTPLLLESLEVERSWIPRLLTIAQGSEVVSLFLLPAILARFGIRGAKRLGLAAAAVTLSALAIGKPLPLVLAGLGLYGLCISCFLVAGQMFLNQRSREDVRASAQAIHSVLCGTGLLFGNVLVGVVRNFFDGSFAPTFGVGAGLAFGLFLFFVITFPRDASSERPVRSV